jgi:membrane dipeptidase
MKRLVIAAISALCGFAAAAPTLYAQVPGKENSPSIQVQVSRNPSQEQHEAFHSNSTASATAYSTSPLAVLDAHEDVLQRVLDNGDDLEDDSAHGQADIPKWKAGGVNIVWFSIWVSPNHYPGKAGVDRAHSLIRALQKQIAKHPDDLEACDSAADCRRTIANGKIAALIGIEGGCAINNDISMLAEYRQLGARYMTLTWRGNLAWAGSSQSEDPTMGLTSYGERIVREMNRLGIIVDLSHVSDQTFYDAIRVSSRPVIVSHSNARALANHPRNVSDDMLRTLAKNGGVIGVNFNSDFLRDQQSGFFSRAMASSTSIKNVLDQIDHIVKVAGIDHVGFGSDWDGEIDPARGLATASSMRNLISGLRERGYSEAQIRKIAGENFLRVLEANDTHAQVPAVAGQVLFPPRQAH